MLWAENAEFVQAMAPQEAPQDDEQHALLAKDVGVATDHEAFVLWRLTQHLGAGAFSKVGAATPPTCSCSFTNTLPSVSVLLEYTVAAAFLGKH